MYHTTVSHTVTAVATQLKNVPLLRCERRHITSVLSKTFPIIKLSPNLQTVVPINDANFKVINGADKAYACW